MAKKKKTQMKPVARGFATVSVPKKVAPADETGEGAKENPLAGSSKDGVANEKKEENGCVGQNPTLVDEFDPEKVEEQSIQNLVDRLQEKTEKEIARCVSHLWLDAFNDSHWVQDH